MGFKSIELQVAIPRSQDAGKMQEQMTKQGQQFQETLTELQLRDELIKRNKVNQFDSVEDQIIKDEDKEQGQHEQDGQSKKGNQSLTAEQEIDHPFLGKHVDFSG